MAVTEAKPEPELFPEPPTEPAPAPRAAGAYLPYFPGLDGVRGLAVVAVLVFHAGFGWAVGGYLGVSTFFTLFLIPCLYTMVDRWKKTPPRDEEQGETSEGNDPEAVHA